MKYFISYFIKGKKKFSYYNCFFIVFFIYVYIVIELLNYKCGVEFNVFCVNFNLLWWVGLEKVVLYFCLVDFFRYMFNVYIYIDVLM